MNKNEIEECLNSYNPSSMFKGLDYYEQLRLMFEITQVLYEPDFDLNILVYNNIKMLLHDRDIPHSIRYFFIRRIIYHPEESPLNRTWTDGAKTYRRLLSCDQLLFDLLKYPKKDETEAYRMWMIQTYEKNNICCISETNEIDELITKLIHHADWDKCQEYLSEISNFMFTVN